MNHLPLSQGEIVLIDKPLYLTSAAVVNALKPAFPGQKIGHAGTLDPLATGLLIILVGSATKLFSYFQTLPKTYITDVLLGQTTITLDTEGQITQSTPPATAQKQVNLDNLTTALTSFPKNYRQNVPVFSAAKYKGKPLYYWARKGQTINLPTKSKTVHIYDLKLIKHYIDTHSYPHAVVKLTVSSGFYVRQFAADLGKKLKLPAHLTALRRTAVGDFNLEPNL